MHIIINDADRAEAQLHFLSDIEDAGNAIIAAKRAAAAGDFVTSAKKLDEAESAVAKASKIYDASNYELERTYNWDKLLDIRDELAEAAVECEEPPSA